MDITFNAVKLWYVTRNFLRKICPSFRTNEYYTSEWTRTDLYDIETVTRVRHGTADVRKAVWYPNVQRASYNHEELFAPVMPPWLSIRNGDQDKTDDMSPYIVKGNVITTELLGSSDWYYMHPKTFDEIVFPSEGIVIE